MSYQEGTSPHKPYRISRRRFIITGLMTATSTSLALRNLADKESASNQLKQIERQKQNGIRQRQIMYEERVKLLPASFSGPQLTQARQQLNGERDETIAEFVSDFESKNGPINRANELQKDSSNINAIYATVIAAASAILGWRYSRVRNLPPRPKVITRKTPINQAFSFFPPTTKPFSEADEPKTRVVPQYLKDAFQDKSLDPDEKKS